MTAPSPQPTTHRIGPYDLDDRIAVGGMAEVFRAHESRAAGDRRVVVVKRMLPHLAVDPEAKAMFRDEARLGEQVQHPNVVRVLGAGEADGHPYLVLEYVRGCDLWRLTRWLTRGGRVLGTELASFVACELLGGLHAVHEARDDGGRPLGIVHSDVSPSNVLLSVFGDVKLADFGIARSKLKQGAQASSGRTKGKIGYLSPEQVIGRPIDRRADVFAAAVIVAELLLGRPLFAGGSELAILLAIRDGRIEPLRESAARLPGGLVDVLARALAAEPDARTLDADALRAELLGFTGDDPGALRRELAEIVASAIAGEDEANALPPTAQVDLAGRTPAFGIDLSDSGPPTADLQATRYLVTTETGRAIGQFDFARIVEAIATGRVGVNDLVSVDGAVAKPLYTIADLCRHLPSSSMTPLTRETEQARAADRKCDFAEGGFVAALARSVITRETGLWLCENGGARKEIYVADGSPEFVTSNLAGELLGEFLVGRGVINRGELDMALALMPRYEGRLGDTLVALGLVDAIELFRHIADQVREKLVDVFLWTSGQASFYRGVPPPPSGFPLGLDAWQLLDEGLRRRLAQGHEESRFAAHLFDQVTHVHRLPRELATANLPPLVAQTIALTRKPIPLQELVEKLEDARGRDPGRGYRVIALLFHLDVLRWL